MSGRAAALALWGAEATDRALAYAAPAPVTPRLLADVRAHLTTDAELAAWARSLDLATFAAVVRIVTGETRLDLLRGAQAADRREMH